MIDDRPLNEKLQYTAESDKASTIPETKANKCMDARRGLAAYDLSNVITNLEATLTSAFLRLVGIHTRASCSVLRRACAPTSKV